MRILRLLKIITISLRFGLDRVALEVDSSGRLVFWWGKIFFWRRYTEPRGVRLRKALESLGPIFIKFGQVLSTRQDLLPDDIANELKQLQDNVPPFPSEEAVALLEDFYGRPVDEVFCVFERTPTASASVAQVHMARLHDGTHVAVKVLRPGIGQIIEHDIGLLETGARLLEKAWSEGRRFKVREVVNEFATSLRDELDLMREAANCAQLRRNFKDSELLVVPEVYWDYCGTQVMVMERMYGTPISNIPALIEQGIDLKALSRAGVEIFFTQVFRDGFFHADMHAGNIFVAPDGRYIALDFGIMGTMNDVDKEYLACQLFAFFKRDYRRVSQSHIDAGWVPPDTRVDEFEAAIRTVCEPIFDRPLKDISFGKTLMRLFQTARRFNMSVQPQLVLLEKTLFNVEGLGRQLNPDLDLWTTAKPFLERWMNEQFGWRALVRELKNEVPNWAGMLPQLPRLAHQALIGTQHRRTALQTQLDAIASRQKQQTRVIATLSAVLIALVAFLVWRTI